jgi:hypothetical protein
MKDWKVGVPADQFKIKGRTFKFICDTEERVIVDVLSANISPNTPAWWNEDSNKWQLDLDNNHWLHPLGENQFMLSSRGDLPPELISLLRNSFNIKPVK